MASPIWAIVSIIMAVMLTGLPLLICYVQTISLQRQLEKLATLNDRAVSNASFFKIAQSTLKSITPATLQMSLFDASLAEVTTTEGQRYILRRNPQRAKEIAASRESKYGALKTAMAAANEYLATHPRANPDTQLKNLRSRAAKLRVSGWTTFNLEGRKTTPKSPTVRRRNRQGVSGESPLR